MKLNSAQQRAVEIDHGNLLILAGPGTGKTRVIISKIEALFKKGVVPEKILAVTFSKRATQEMEERLTQYDSKVARQVEISTLHSLCVDLVNRHAFRIGFQKRPTLMSEAQAYLYFRKLAAKLPLAGLMQTSSLDAVLPDLLQLFQECKDEGLWPEDLLKAAQRMNDQTEIDLKLRNEWLALGEIYNAYQNFCFREGLMDFGDAILLSLQILKDHPQVAKEFHEQYEVVLVDEFQDTNWSQVQLLRAISSPQAHVAVVGDDDQAIYRFRGASFSAFRFFQEAFPNTEVIELNETYRLSPSISATASQLIAANGAHRFRPDKQLKSFSTVHEPVQVLQFDSYETEAISICDQIDRLLREGVPPKEIAILVRSHHHSEIFLQEARRRALPLEAMTKESLFDQEIVRDALALFRLLQNPQDNISFMRLLDSAFLRLPESDIYEFCRWATGQRKTYFELLEKIDEATLRPEAKEALKKFSVCYQAAKAHMARRSASEILFQFYEATSIVSELLKSSPQDLERLGYFHSQIHSWQAALDDRSLAAVMPLLETYSRHESTLEGDEPREISEAIVPILTVHASKGLEFRFVFILSLVGRRFPSNFRKSTFQIPTSLRREEAPTKESHIEEERRLFYVAMTRAKERLFLSTIDKKGTKPSYFLTEDLKNCASLEWKKFESKENSFLKPTALKALSRAGAAAVKPKIAESLRLSFTQLDSFQTCPLAYRFRYELRIPTASSVALSQGSAIHSALEKFYGTLDAKSSEERLIKFYHEAFDDQLKGLTLLEESDRALGETKLREFYQFQKGKFEKPLALEADFSIQVGPHTLRGKMDRVDGTKSGVTIVDYKTGRAKNSEDEKHQKFADDSLQLSIYAIAAEECYKWKVDELVLYYIFENTSLVTRRTPKQLEATKEQVIEIASQIQKSDFSPRPGFHCQFCEYKDICPTPQVT